MSAIFEFSEYQFQRALEEEGWGGGVPKLIGRLRRHDRIEAQNNRRRM